MKHDTDVRIHHPVMAQEQWLLWSLRYNPPSSSGLCRAPVIMSVLTAVQVYNLGQPSDCKVSIYIAKQREFARNGVIDYNHTAWAWELKLSMVMIPPNSSWWDLDQSSLYLILLLTPTLIKSFPVLPRVRVCPLQLPITLPWNTNV